jgi:hypothetical protein
MSPQVELLLEARAGFSRTRAALQACIRSAERGGAEVRIDADTYWAPSVNARAIILSSRERGTVTVILHGDTDG